MKKFLILFITMIVLFTTVGVIAKRASINTPENSLSEYVYSSDCEFHDYLMNPRCVVCNATSNPEYILTTTMLKEEFEEWFKDNHYRVTIVDSNVFTDQGGDKVTVKWFTNYKF